MQQYKITIQYDGTDYAGWQVQPDSISVAQKLQDTFFTVFNRSIVLYAVSRTDAGVHALGQIATFKTDLVLAPSALLKAWNARLPFDITIVALEPVADLYNPHAHILYKTYWYHFFPERPLPTQQRFGWQVRYPVDQKKLLEALTIFIGTYDFKAFSTDDDRENTIRTITAVSVAWADDLNAYRIAISGPKFLRHMVRRIVGASLYVAGRPHLAVELLQKALSGNAAGVHLPTAPAKGLMLYEVVYEKV